MSVSDFTNLIALTAALVVPAVILPPLSRFIGSWASDVRRCGSLGVSFMLLMSAGAHFTSTAGMALMLPPWVPMREVMIVLTGIWVLVLAGALWAPGWNRRAGLIVAVTLIVFLPANVYAAMMSVPFGGNVLGPTYLVVRVPFQVFLVLWTLWATGWLPKSSPPAK